MLTSLAQAQPAASEGGSGLVTLLPLILMVGVMYFLLIRPQQKRQRAQREMIRELAVGDEVVTIGGFYGTIRSIDEDTDDVILEVAPGTTMRMIRGAIARPVSEDTPEDDDEGVEDDHDDDDVQGAIDPDENSGA